MSVEVRTSGNRVGELRQLLVKSQEQIALALPKHLTAERMIRVAITAVQKSPELLKCDLVSILGCVIQASQLGLELDGILGHAYLVPFKNKKERRLDAQLIVGYKGYLALARRSGEVSSFFAHVVHANDCFKFAYGTQGHVTHVPRLTGRGEPVAVYAVIRLKDGSSDFEVLGWEEIQECQRRYARVGQDGKPYGPWIDSLEEMARKTAIRRLAKRCPVSVEIQRAAAVDEAEDAGATAREELGLTRMDALAEKLAPKLPQGGSGTLPPPPEPEEGELVYDRSESQEVEERAEGAAIEAGEGGGA